ncbi:MAG: hypothetical protein WCD43_17905 [Candidatus Acidiferrales bacterium]
MKIEDIKWLKEYEAAERGVSPSEIADSEAIASYGNRRRVIFAGLLLAVFLYLVLRIFSGTIAGRMFVTAISLTSIGLCLNTLRWPSPLRPGQKLAIKKELSGYLSVKIDQVSDELARQFNNWNWRQLTLLLVFAAVTTLTYDWIRPNIALELVDLFMFYLVGMFAWRRLRMNGRVTNR